MAYDEELAARVRAMLGGRTGAEKKMFGGLAFMVDGRMALAVSGQGGLMLKVGDPTELLTRDHVEPVEMRGRQMRQWIVVASAALTTDASLQEWVDRALAG